MVDLLSDVLLTRPNNIAAGRLDAPAVVKRLKALGGRAAAIAEVAASSMSAPIAGLTVTCSCDELVGIYTVRSVGRSSVAILRYLLLPQRDHHNQTTPCAVRTACRYFLEDLLSLRT